MEVKPIAKKSTLFPGQEVAYSITYDEETELYSVNFNFEDYCIIVLKNTSGKNWTFKTYDLAFNFINSDYKANLCHLSRHIYTFYKQIKSKHENISHVRKTQDLYLRICNFLGEYKIIEYLIDSNGYCVPIPKTSRLVFTCYMKHGSLNYGSHEYIFVLRLYPNCTLISDYFASEHTFFNFTAKEVGKVFDINEPASNIINALDSNDFAKLINNKLKTYDIENLQDSDLDKIRTLNILMEFIKAC